MSIPLLRAALLVALVLPVPAAFARDVRVNDVTALRAAVNAAMPGDVILLAPGTYRLTSRLSCAANGTASQRIVLRSEVRHAARLEVDTLIGLGVSGAFWTFEDLEVRGVCASDAACEHAFQVTGGATDVVLRGNRLIDFNAQLKVNAVVSSPGNAVMPHRGLVEANEIFDTRPRNLGSAGNPVTKLNIDTGDDWVVRDNYLHDWRKNGGNFVSYGVFLKSGGKRGVMERNLVICATQAVPLQSGNDARIGLSFGGGGTGGAFCFPAFDANTPCTVEHEDGIARNNVVVNCSDVALYVNRGRNTRVLYNTFIATTGVDFRFDTTTGAAVGNVTSGAIRQRDMGTFSGMANLTGVTTATFDGWYTTPLTGDLSLQGSVSMLVGAGPRDALVTDDFCGRPRPASGPFTQGALEHSLGSCVTTKPPMGGAGGGSAGGGSAGGGSAGGGSAGGGSAAGGSAAGGSAGGGSAGGSAGGGSAGGEAGGPGVSAGGTAGSGTCSCSASETCERGRCVPVMGGCGCSSAGGSLVLLSLWLFSALGRRRGWRP
ncbi:MAG: PE-PGRS family protein [Myxococcaceae bacterium]|nr:PE-PGRS family protein [Myxococcaceae bacterium]